MNEIERTITFSAQGHIKQRIIMRRKHKHITTEELIHYLNTGEYQTPIQ